MRWKREKRGRRARGRRMVCGVGEVRLLGGYLEGACEFRRFQSVNTSARRCRREGETK